MKITIVTISYNQIKYLQRCMESILCQENTDIEYIVVDPGSTDGSRELIESYGDRIVKVFEKDNGPADGLNRGFARATGDVCGFINSDDYLLPGALRAINDYYTQYGLNSFISGPGFILEKSGRFKPISPTRMELRPLLFGACTVFQQGTFFPAEFFRAVGGFNPENRTCWDGELFRDFLAAGFEHRLIDQPLAVFRLHEGSISGSGRLEEAYRADCMRLFEKAMGRPMAFRDTFESCFWRTRKVAQKVARTILTGVQR